MAVDQYGDVITEAVEAHHLWEHFLASPLSPARFRDAKIVFMVASYDYDAFCDTVDRLGWERIEVNELSDETVGYAHITVRRSYRPARSGDSRRSHDRVQDCP